MTPDFEVTVPEWLKERGLDIESLMRQSLVTEETLRRIEEKLDLLSSQPAPVPVPSPTPPRFHIPPERLRHHMVGYNDTDLMGFSVTGPWWGKPISQLRAQGVSHHAASVQGTRPEYGSMTAWWQQLYRRAWPTNYLNLDWFGGRSWAVIVHASNATMGQRVSVQCSKMAHFGLNDDGTWDPLGVFDLHGHDRPSFATPGTVKDLPTKSWMRDGGWALSDDNPVLHPWSAEMFPVWSGQYRCIVSAAFMRLVGLHADTAQRLALVGMDHYCSTSPTTGWWPGAYTSRAVRLTSEWQPFMAGAVDGGRTVDSADSTITLDEYEQNPPDWDQVAWGIE